MTVLYIYITIFTIFYIILALASLKSTKKIRDKYTNHDSNICVVVYASGKVDTLENLLKQLKKERISSVVVGLSKRKFNSFFSSSSHEI